MAKISEQLSLALESFSGLPAAGGHSLFDRNERIHALVDGFINCAHATVAELAHDAITVLEDGVGGKHHPDRAITTSILIEIRIREQCTFRLGRRSPGS